MDRVLALTKTAFDIVKTDGIFVFLRRIGAFLERAHRLLKKSKKIVNQSKQQPIIVSASKSRYHCDRDKCAHQL